MSYPFWTTKTYYRYLKSMPLITKLPLMLLKVSYLVIDHSDLLNLTMKDGNVIPYVSKCLDLGTTIYTMLYVKHPYKRVRLS